MLDNVDHTTQDSNNTSSVLPGSTPPTHKHPTSTQHECTHKDIPLMAQHEYTHKISHGCTQEQVNRKS